MLARKGRFDGAFSMVCLGMRSLLPYIAVLDGILLAALGTTVACGATTSSDGGTDGSSNDGPVIFESGGFCFEASTPIAYDLCGDASDAGADACASSCTEACQRLYFSTSFVSCTDDGMDAGTAFATCVHILCAGGRRPTGLQRPRNARAGSQFARWLAGAAWMERASVRSFERLARELEAHGAPRWLVREARRARTDEARHAQEVGKLARAHRVRVPRVHFRKCSVRSLVTIARENAVEGCVHETYGALAALVQSERATDAGVRDAMRRIAPDEKRHAALALAVSEWIAPKLTSTERARVACAKNRAAERLLSALEKSPSIPVAGLLGGARARELGRRLFTAA